MSKLHRYTGNGRPQTPLTRLAAQRNFAKLRLEGAKTLTGIFKVFGPNTQTTFRASVKFKELVEILDALEEEIDLVWLARKEEIKNGK